MAVVLRLEPTDASPTLGDLATALDHPARPLFIGRKSCLPSGPIFSGWIEEAANVRAALQEVAPQGAPPLPAVWPEFEGADGAYRITDVTDERNWLSGLHGGARRQCEGRIAASKDRE